MKPRSHGQKRFSRSPLQLAILSILAGASTAHAQAQAPAPESPKATLEQIVVTATKTATPLQQTPLAVTSLSASDLEKAQVQTIVDFVHLVPSFQATTQGDHGVITMTLRGVGNDSAKTEYADPEVGVFIDGIYSPRAEGAAVLLFDMESIEVLRGPQGTLWGRNSTVGAINMQTAKPVLKQNFGTIEGGIGDYNRIGLRGAFNASLGETAAIRMAFVHEQHDGYVNYQEAPHLSIASQQAAFVAGGGNLANFQPINPNLFTQGGPKYNAQDQSAARLSLLWKPTRNLTWNVSYEKFLDRGTPDMNLMQDPRPGQSFWSALIDTAPYLKRDVDTFRSRLDFDMGGMSLAYIAGYSRFKGSSDFDQDGGAHVPTSFTTGATFQEDRTNWSKYTNYSHELNLQSTGKRDVDWILGAYYAAEDNGIRFDIPIMNGTQQGTVGWQGSFIQPKETVASKAIFGQATWNLGDLHLTGGLRYTSDDRKNIGGNGYGWNYGADPVPAVPIDPGLDPTKPGSGFTPNSPSNEGHFTGKKTTYLARARYDVDKNFLTYASISTGYKSGGLQDGGRPYGAETLTNYEFGTKNTFMGGRVTFNNSIYYMDFKDFQFSAPVTNADGTHTLVTSNAEGAKIYGLESELAAKPTPDDRLSLVMAFTHTKLGKLLGGSNDYTFATPCPDPSIANCLDVTGHELPHAPRFAGTLLYEHTFALSEGATVAPRISLHYETSSWLSVFNYTSGDKQDAYSRTDLGLRYTARKGWYVDGYVRNVGDGKVKTSAQNAFGVWQSQYMPPRTFGFNAGVEF
jgi:iron complex outermembrane receptor protein